MNHALRRFVRAGNPRGVARGRCGVRKYAAVDRGRVRDTVRRVLAAARS